MGREIKNIVAPNGKKITNITPAGWGSIAHIAVDGESGDIIEGEDGVIIQENIFTSEGINWLSFTYKCKLDIPIEKIIPKETLNFYNLYKQQF